MGGSHGWQKACMSEALWRSLHGRVFLFLFFCNWHHIPFLRNKKIDPKNFYHTLWKD
jgi:hypothetical protein